MVTTILRRQVSRRFISVFTVLLTLCLVAPDATAADGSPEPATAQEQAPVKVGAPFIFTAPTGRIIPSGVIYPRASFDTSESFLGGARIGLGGFAEFGFTSTPYVRYERLGEDKARFFDGYPLVFGRVGANEGELWSGQPGFALGYRKSFVVTYANRETQLSEINLAFTKQLGSRVSLTVGVSKWDGQIELDARGDDAVWALNEETGWGQRIKPFFGLEVSPLEGFRLMAEFYYMPEFEFELTPHTPEIELDAATSLGLRSELWPWLILDLGARGPDFSNLHQLDVEAFAQVIVPLRFLHDALR